MLRVKTYLDKSPIDGIGVFAAENIKAGEIVWHFVPALDKTLDIMEWFAISEFGHPIDRNFLRKYAFLDKQTDKLILSGDNDRFTNHSDSPNTRPDETGDMFAIRDIKEGEEITANYYEFDKYADKKLHLSMF
jgi:SET domain-containing protein